MIIHILLWCFTILFTTFLFITFGAESVELARTAMPDSVNKAQVYSRYAGSLKAAGRFEEAAAAYLEAHRISDALGPGHPRASMAAYQLRILYQRWHAAEPNAGHDVAAARWRSLE